MAFNYAIKHALKNGKNGLKNGLKNGVNGNGNGIKGYISAADRLKIPRKTDGSIHLNTKDKDFLLKKNAIRSDIADKKSTSGYNHVFIDGSDRLAKVKKGNINEIKNLSQIGFPTQKATKKSGAKRAKSTKATSLTDEIALTSYMRYKQITDSTELTPFDYQEIERYTRLTHQDLSNYKSNVKAKRLVDGDTTDGHLVSPHDPTAVNSARQRFAQPGRNYIDEDGDQVIGNFGQGEASGELNRIEKIAMGIPTNWYEDLVMFFDPSQRGVREYLNDKTINEIVTKRNWKGAFKKSGLNANEIFTGDYEGIGRALDVFD